MTDLLAKQLGRVGGVFGGGSSSSGSGGGVIQVTPIVPTEAVSIRNSVHDNGVKSSNTGANAVMDVLAALTARIESTETSLRAEMEVSMRKEIAAREVNISPSPSLQHISP